MTFLPSVREAVADLLYPEGRNRREELERLADTDPLTGVANRRALDRALPTAEADPHTRVCLFDANCFGLVNKECGHAAGDELLRQMARSITHAAERFGFGVRVFRAGGDEFVVLASEVAAYHIRDAAELDFGTVTLRAGFNVSLSGTVGRTLADADASLQARKAARKGSASSSDLRQEVQG